MVASRDFVVVVSGVPRSGTSLLMQMLVAGGLPVFVDSARPPDAHNPRGYFEFEPAKALAENAAWLPQAIGHAVKVVHTLVASLPEGFDYRLVLMRRDLAEVVASQDAMLAGSAPPGPSARRLAEIYAHQLAELEQWLDGRPGSSALEQVGPTANSTLSTDAILRTTAKPAKSPPTAQPATAAAGSACSAAACSTARSSSPASSSERRCCRRASA